MATTVGLVSLLAAARRCNAFTVVEWLYPYVSAQHRQSMTLLVSRDGVSRRNWDKPDCWFEADCFKLKEGEFGPQIRGSRRPPLNRADGLIGDTYFGYPAFYVRNHLQGFAVS